MNREQRLNEKHVLFGVGFDNRQILDRAFDIAICPGSFLPLKTLLGEDEAPIEPTARWYLEPCFIGPRCCPVALDIALEALALAFALISTLSPSSKIAHVISLPAS